MTVGACVRRGLLAAGVAVVVGLAGCDGGGAPAPSSGVSSTQDVGGGASGSAGEASVTPGVSVGPTSTLQPTSRPSVSVPSADVVAGLLVEAFAVGFGSDAPADGQRPDEVTAAVAGLTSDDGTARGFVLSQTDAAFNEALGWRGEVVGEPVGQWEVGGDVVSGRVCMAQVLESITDGPATSDDYVVYEVSAVPDGGGWVLHDAGAVLREGGRGAKPCVPPSLQQQITQAWNDYHDARAAHLAAPADEAAFERVEAYWPGFYTLGNQGFRLFENDIHLDLTFLGATPDSVHTTWCVDHGLDPDARIEHEDGTTERPGDLREVWEATWQRGDDNWYLTDVDKGGNAQDPNPVLAGAFEQCFS